MLDYNSVERYLLGAISEMRTSKVSVTINLRGGPGVGKSTLAETVGKQLGMPTYLLNVSTVTPADLLGNATTTYELEKDGDIKFVPDVAIVEFLKEGYKVCREITTYTKPSWWSDKPMILILDDDTRSRDPRIFPAIMEIKRTGRYTSWELAPGSCVISTANEDDGESQVNPTDNAQESRQVTIRMKSNPLQALQHIQQFIPGYLFDFLFLKKDIYVNSVSDTKINGRNWRNIGVAMRSLNPKDSQDILIINEIMLTNTNAEIATEFSRFLKESYIELPSAEELLINWIDKRESYAARVQNTSSIASQAMNSRIATYVIGNKGKVSKKALVGLASMMEEDFIPHDKRCLLGDFLVSHQPEFMSCKPGFRLEKLTMFK